MSIPTIRHESVNWRTTMSIPTIRYESASLLTMPFELGVRHFKLATCDGSQETLLYLAKERIIYRPSIRALPSGASSGQDNKYTSLTVGKRAYHITVGVLETVGYLTLIVPFIIAVADLLLNQHWFPRGRWVQEDEYEDYGDTFRTHMTEGGWIGDWFEEVEDWRKNPFDADGIQDPFYQGASWLPRIAGRFN